MEVTRKYKRWCNGSTWWRRTVYRATAPLAFIPLLLLIFLYALFMGMKGFWEGATEVLGEVGDANVLGALKRGTWKRG